MDAPVPQVTEEIIEMFNVLSQDRVQQRNVEQITETPAVSLAEEIVEAPKAQTQEKRIHERIVEKPDVPVPRVTEKTIEVVKFSPQERVQNRTVRQIIDVSILRVMEEILEVETLLADNKLSSKLAGSCAAQAPEWEKRQRVRAEELVTIHDTNKLLNNDSLELFKETAPSPSLMQLQSDKGGVARRARTVVKTSLGSSRVNSMSLGLNSRKVTSTTDEVAPAPQQEQNDDDNKKTSCLIDTGRTQN